MGHKHSVYDTDTHFIINAITKAIKNESSRKIKLIQGDHNSERFTFEIPRYIEGHDMSLCNKVEVHYLNTSFDAKRKQSGHYEVEDLQISPEDENIVMCSWLISGNATQIEGSLNFLLKYRCVEDKIVTYAWNTDIFTGISIGEGIDASEEFESEYADVIEQWKESVMKTFTDDLARWKTITAEEVREEAFADITVQKERIDHLSNYVTPQMFGAKGDGVTDDTEAFKAMLGAKPEFVIIPKGTYSVTQVDFSGMTNSRIVCFGEFINMSTDVYGVVVLGGNRNVFDGFVVNGNSSNVSGGSIGETCAILINTNATDCEVLNAKIYDTNYCGFIFNAGVNGCTFRNIIFENIGEHCFYIGNTENIIIDCVKTENHGCNSECINSSHDCEVIKVSANCKNLTIKNMIVEAESKVAYGFNFNDSENITIENVKVVGGTGVFVSGNNVENLTIADSFFGVALSSSYFKSGAAFHCCTITSIGSMNERVIFNGCKFVINYAEFVLEKDVVFNNCDFVFETNTIRLNRHSNITFNGCSFSSKAETHQGCYMLTDQNTNEDVCTITFNNCVCLAKNYSGLLYGSKKANATFNNCDLTGVNANVGIVNLVINNSVCSNGISVSGWESTTAHCNNVKNVNNISTTKKTYEANIPSGSSEVFVSSMRYETFRKISAKDITLINATNNMFVYADVVETADNQALYIKTKESVATTTKVFVIIDINE